MRLTIPIFHKANGLSPDSFICSVLQITSSCLLIVNLNKYKFQIFAKKLHCLDFIKSHKTCRNVRFGALKTVILFQNIITSKMIIFWPGSNAVLHMSRTQFNQLGSCEVRRLTQLSSTDFYLERLRRSSRLASREERLKTDFGSNSDFHMSRTKRIINDNQSYVMLIYESEPQMYESASISVFLQHGSLLRWF